MGHSKLKNLKYYEKITNAKIWTIFDICKKKSLSTLAKALSEPINNTKICM